MKQKKKNKKSASLAFYLAIPVSFVVAILSVLVFLSLFLRYPFDRTLWSLFVAGLLASVSIVASTSMPRFETFIHELKHAILVICTGNRLTDFHVDKGTGHVQYQMYTDRVHFVPFIVLAPYCLPLFSLPVLILGLALGNDYHRELALALGVALGGDIALGIQELHPGQSDLKAVFGGFLLAAAYIGGILFCWTSFCFLWVLAGKKGFLFLGYELIRLGTQIWDKFLS